MGQFRCSEKGLSQIHNLACVTAVRPEVKQEEDVGFAMPNDRNVAVVGVLAVKNDVVETVECGAFDRSARLGRIVHSGFESAFHFLVQPNDRGSLSPKENLRLTRYGLGKAPASQLRKDPEIERMP